MNKLFTGMFKKKDGAALITVIVVFVVLMIFVAALAVLSSSNVKQTKRQEYKIQAYYLALSGVDLGVAALQANDDRIFNKYKAPGVTPAPITDTIEDPDSNGSIRITIEAKDIKNKDNVVERWVSITATGIHSASGVSSTSSLRILGSNKEVIVRSSDTE